MKKKMFTSEQHKTVQKYHDLMMIEYNFKNVAKFI